MTIAIDTGGTFTDCVYVEDGELRVKKLFSTPGKPETAVLEGVRAVAGSAPVQVRHGTTVGTNTLLERKGARVALVTTAGFEDAIAIGRQARRSLYDWFAKAEQPLVPPERRFGVNERVSADGEILRAPSEAELTNLREAVGACGAEAVAISLLFSFANPENEWRVRNALSDLGIPVSLSHQVLPEFREFERTSTVLANAYLIPRAGGYVSKLNGSVTIVTRKTGTNRSLRFSGLEVMQSSGGTAEASFAAEQPVRTVLSGPAGGVMGACFVSSLAGLKKIVAFDMGGTSTDVSAVELDAGGPAITNESTVAGLPISVPAIDIHTVGAGGGSIAYFDKAGVLHVGPESAGADPGPICYGRGNRPTVSDANAVLGRLDPGGLLDGAIPLHIERTRERIEAERGPFDSAEEFAYATVTLAEAQMEQAIRVISVERGHDPREFTLIAFGGAGPLHACALAKALGMPRVLVPALPGALSALGILVSDRVREYSRTVMKAQGEDLEPWFAELERDAGEGIKTRSVDLRYRGQGYELSVPWSEDHVLQFHAAHRKRFGFSGEHRPVEVVNVRVRVTESGEPLQLQQREIARRQSIPEAMRPVYFDGEYCRTDIYSRADLGAGDRLRGPAIVNEYSSTVVIPPDWEAAVDGWGNLVLQARPE